MGIASGKRGARLVVIAAVLVLVAASCRLEARPFRVLPIGFAAIGDLNNHNVAAATMVERPTECVDYRQVPAVVDLETDSVTILPGLDGCRGNAASSINDAGVTVGGVRAAGANESQPARWDPAKGYALEVLPHPGGHSGGASAINNDGVVVGTSYPPNTAFAHAFAYLPETGEIVDISSTLGLSSRAHDVSDTGLVVGTAVGTDGLSLAFTFDLATRTGRILDPPPGHPNMWASAVNPSGTLVVGTAFGTDPGANTPHQAFVHHTKTGELWAFDPLGGKFAIATDVNDKEIVVGFSRDVDGASRVFALDAKTQQMPDLGNVGGVSQWVSINESLHVAGTDWLRYGWLPVGDPMPFTGWIGRSPP